VKHGVVDPDKVLEPYDVTAEDVDPDADDDQIETDLTFIGLQAMIDPPHDNIDKALAETRAAGITTLMLTGDNPVTAKAIADQVGLVSNDVLTGQQTENLADEELLDRISGGTAVFARVSPFHKLRILKLLRRDHRVAMTGDGVNDVLAIKRADVGIAMGQRGTEVAKEASDIVLLDDNYKSIVAAVREGRRIFDNVRKFVNYLFVSNIAEILVIFILTLILSLEEPVLLPLHLLWINLLTDGAPALAFGADPAREDIMRRPPRKKNEPIVNRRLGMIIGTMSTLYTAFLILVFFIMVPYGVPVASTTLFTGFIIFEFMRIGVIRQTEALSWSVNPWLLVGVGVSILLQLVLLYTPLNELFHVVPLGVYPWLVLIVTSALGFACSLVLVKAVLWWFDRERE